jgi:Cof subfamily protein (haloacid dehalogenase superfamily)
MPAPDPILPIRLIALDIDGTLIGDDLTIGSRTRAAIQAASERGVAISLVTGRMVSSAMQFATILGLTGPIVGYQGGLIRAMPPVDSQRLGKLLVHTPLPATAAQAILRWTREQGMDPHVNHLERFILRADDPRADDYSAFMGARAELVDDLISAVDHPVTKVLAVGEPPVPDTMAPLARAHFRGVADVTISHPRFLEFVAPGTSKGRAVRWLARRAGVPLGATLAVGDQWNDLEMLGEVGHGAAMPTAPAGVRTNARYLAPPLAEEGVAQLIEGLVLASPTKAAAYARQLAADARRAADVASADQAADAARAADPTAAAAREGTS